MAAPLTLGPPGQPPLFDRRGFLRKMNILGRPYRNQAMELISICRTFSISRAAEQILTQDAALSNVLQACDAALACAAEAREKTSLESDQRIGRAIRKLCDYEGAFHPRDEDDPESVTERMRKAVNKDKERQSRFSLLSFRAQRTRTEDGSLRVVNFRLLRSITDTRPTIVQQVLTNDYESNQSEILWNFRRYRDDSGKRITLTENPHFYHHHHLPIISPNAHLGGFPIDPMDNFRDVEDIPVLTSKPGRMFFEFGTESRAFDNFWRTNEMNEIFILKSVCGRLESENIVVTLIQGRSCRWCHAGPLPSQSEEWETLQNWREPIHHVLHSHDIKIRVVPDPN